MKYVIEDDADRWIEKKIAAGEKFGLSWAVRPVIAPDEA